MALLDFGVVCGGSWADFFLLLGVALVLARFGGSRVDLCEFLKSMIYVGMKKVFVNGIKISILIELSV